MPLRWHTAFIILYGDEAVVHIARPKHYKWLKIIFTLLIFKFKIFWLAIDNTECTVGNTDTPSWIVLIPFYHCTYTLINSKTLFTACQSVKCYRCTHEKEMYERGTLACSDFDYSDAFVVNCDSSTMCFKRVTSLDLGNGRK